ncbi:MAG: pyridoxal phosphate-dependent aminotransferase [Gammaproteobacteria bacterium]
MHNWLSQRVSQVKTSPTLAMSMRANALKAAGHDIISLSVGEPDFDTPQYIKDAAIDAINKGFTKYTAVDGIASLKKAIINKFARENQLTYQSAQVVTTCGVKHGLYNLMQAIINPGDEVIILAPYWVSYPDIVLLAEGKPVFIETTLEQHFKITAEQLAKAITPKTRLIIINSPSNPSGMAYSKAELAKLAEILLKFPDILIASDDMYEHILWTGEPFVNIVNACPALYDRTIVFNGVSKAYAMTGWRIGYAAGPIEIIAAMITIQSQNTSNPNSIAQVASQVALDGDQKFITTLCQAFKERHDYVVRRLKTFQGFKCIPSQGTFYTLPNVEGVLQKLGIANDLEFTDYLLNNAGVAVVPGSPFGSPGYIRISYATGIENLTKAMDRIEAAINQVKVATPY